ncbi:hypothetical protein DOTSEDRAFT_69515 [Dothistroma septosporum NZE10]|uniref:Uncharacterized protein n=1 Tax=Dothistroma septosporum (strain NZE10 / CBS 128990) TaxID=675120 RepID=N1PYX2_DOTSN|nr:hypothetical protein DOTSEDRAFT_69515 [Dothistroma septosporum NZE10]
MQWTDRSVPAIAQQLKPGGTFAALDYSPLPTISSSERAQRAWMSINYRCGELWHANGEYVARAYAGRGSVREPRRLELMLSRWNDIVRHWRTRLSSSGKT